MADPRQATVLVVQHEAGCTPAWFGSWLADADVALDVRHPYRGDALPSDLAGHDGLLVLGGSMGAYDDERYPWLTATKDLLRAGVEAGVPTLGICLGHQLLAVACGGRVERDPAGPSIGVVELAATAASAADPLLGRLTFPARTARWNEDVVVDLPAGVTAVAADATGGTQAVRLGDNAWGLQFHPEAGHEVFQTWATEVRATPDGAQLGDQIDAALSAVQQLELDLALTGERLARAFAQRLRG